MSFLNKYHNYELHPEIKIEGFETSAWEGKEKIVQELKNRIAELSKQNQKIVVCLDCYPGVEKEELLQLAKALNPIRIFEMEEYAKSETVLNKEFHDYITDDRVFGIICHKKLEDFFIRERLERAMEELKAIPSGVVIVIGLGTGILCKADIWIYCSLTRWEIQLRYRAGMPNWNCTNDTAPILEKYKRGFFIEWRLSDRYKKDRYAEFDYLLDTEIKNHPKMVTGQAYREGLKQVSQKPFRMEPYFDPGVWGGKWMQTNFGLDPKQPNFAWSFDGVPEENSFNLKYGDVIFKAPAIDLVLYCPKKLLGERVHGRFGAEFPIRFDLLDTMGGGNLSLQVHPLTEYIQDTFGMHYTQDESYYILDTDDTEETYVYLGVKKNINPKTMEQNLHAAQRGEKEFPVETYVNKIPVKPHDHILIPAGTVHCSGKNTMVLEISATPYIFTFKLWDWGRVGLDGLPRPIHIDHGMKNIQWDRDTDWVYENLVGQEKIIEKGTGYQSERTGLHNREFIDTIRYTLTKPYIIKTEDSVHVMNLVSGSHAFIESVNGSFDPFEVHYAETVIVPASVGQYKIVPENEEIKIIIASVRQ